MKKLAFLAVVLLAAGCCTKKVPFTYRMIEDYNLDESSLRTIQFYNSKKMVLTRVVSDEVAAQEGHDLKRVEDKFIETVKVKKRTPGVVEAVGDDTLKVTFGDGSSFNFTTIVPPKRGPAGVVETPAIYRLTPEGTFKAGEAGGFFYSYGPFKYILNGNEYASHNNRDVVLEVKRTAIENLQKEKKVLPGQKFEDPE